MAARTHISEALPGCKRHVVLEGLGTNICHIVRNTVWASLAGQLNPLLLWSPILVHLAILGEKCQAVGCHPFPE